MKSAFDRLVEDPELYVRVQKLKLCIVLWAFLYLQLTGYWARVFS